MTLLSGCNIDRVLSQIGSEVRPVTRLNMVTFIVNVNSPRVPP
jgi:hypothetical protein